MTNPNLEQEQPKSDAPFEPPGPTPSWLKAVAGFAVELIEIVVISLAIILPIRYFLIQPFYVKGASMEPTFDDHEYLIIDEISYRFRRPERGEVVVFRYPLDPRQYFIKRIIGLPGERVSVADNRVKISNASSPDGFTLDETYLGPGAVTLGDRAVTLGDDEYFVLGDNRASSLDSRTFGPLPKKYITGRVWIRGWPFDRIAVFDRQPVPPSP